MDNQSGARDPPVYLVVHRGRPSESFVGQRQHTRRRLMKPLATLHTLLYASVVATQGYYSPDPDATETHLDCNNQFLDAINGGDVGRVRALLANPKVDPTANNSEAIREAAQSGHVGCVRLLLEDGRADPAANDNDSVFWAAVNGHVECTKYLLADQRVSPGAILLATCPLQTRGLIQCIQRCKDGDLLAFQQMDLTALSDDELCILINRNRRFPEAHGHLLAAQLARLDIPETAKEDPAYKAVVDSAIARGVWGTDALGKVVDIYTIYRTIRHYDY